jgi:hypothetical protein
MVATVAQNDVFFAQLFHGPFAVGMLRVALVAGAAVHCMGCPPGQYPSVVSGECTVCPVGSFCPPGAPAPVACPAGSASSASGAASNATCLECQPGHFAAAGSPACTLCPPGPRGQGPTCSEPLISGFAGWSCTPYGPAQSSISASTLVLLAQPLQSQGVVCTGPAINPLQSFVVGFSIDMTSPLYGGADASWFFFDASQNHAVQLSDLNPLAVSCGPQGCGAVDAAAFQKSADFTYSVSVNATYDAFAGAFWFTVSGESGNGHTMSANSYVVGALGTSALGFGAWNGASAYVRTVTDFVYQAGAAWCPAGAFAQPWGALTQCTLCAAGSWSAAGASNCTPCGAGMISPAPGATAASACALCAAGSWSAEPEAAACAPCGKGAFSPAAGATSEAACMPCTAGTWSGVEGAAVCAPCSAGTFSPAEGATSATTCLPCAEGTWSAAGAAACTPCSAANASLSPCATAAPSSSAAGSSAGHSPTPALLAGAGALGGLFAGAMGLWLAQRLVALRAPSSVSESKDSPLLFAVNE